ncbi:50S ribosomal protein L11 methyltransferase [Texcoconibacillus texcoconensis]|uniref:Ribosomal protein L11 methyltransferase n=1 Tax=Texcoconibacillus texcoconensis TaxID=1095777 RepID=A0A840QRG9_9BACI|nr:50S ribosomal protein L11 methyltransferase [Texcoconibacillus texcoconensis]MBB5173949.1 ribosomal protein L11 methyltransferase [Texcoconibacillus texcoconensis]
MKWSEISIHTSQEAVEPVSNILHESGASGVVIEDPDDLLKVRDTKFGEIYQLSSEHYPNEGVIVKAYLPINSFLGETVEAIKEAINNLIVLDIDIGPNDVSLSEVNEEEWSTAWKKYYKPVKVSEKVTITPTWEDYEKVRDDECVIELDPGMAFGTGTHPTTVLSLQAIEKRIKEGERIVDVGTGSGVLSIAAAKLGAKDVEALDLDEVAVKSARLNAKLNKVQDVVSVEQKNLLEHFVGECDTVVANILAEIIVRMTDDAYRILKPGGTIITSGIIQAKKEQVLESLESSGFVIDEIVEMEEWLAIIAKKPHN